MFGCKLEGHQAREKSRGIKLTDDGFEIRKAARIGMQRCNIAIADGRQGHEAEIDQISDNGEAALPRLETLKGVGYKNGEKAEQGYESES